VNGERKAKRLGRGGELVGLKELLIGGGAAPAGISQEISFEGRERGRKGRFQYENVSAVCSHRVEKKGEKKKKTANSRISNKGQSKSEIRHL